MVVLDYISAAIEPVLVRTGQSNGRPWGHRDREGFVAAPHLRLRTAGQDLTIMSIVGATSNTHGLAGTQSIVTVAEQLEDKAWRLGELRLVHHEQGDSLFSSLRRGHARVIDNVLALSGVALGAGAGLPAFNETTDRIYWPSHGRRAGSRVRFGTQATGFPAGTLPGLDENLIYFVVNPTDHGFQVALAPYGTPVPLAGGSGVCTIAAYAFLVVQWISPMHEPVEVTFGDVGGFLGVVLTAHGLPLGSTASFAASGGGVLPTGIAPATSYFFGPVSPDGGLLSTTYAGLAAPIAFVNAGTPTLTLTLEMLVSVSGYVHLHDRFNSYDNVLAVMPFQPIEPGDYPIGVPVVPGYTLDAEVTTYADAGLVLPFAWNEGIEGHGKSGTAATVAGLVVTFNGGVTAEDKVFADGFIRVGSAKGQIDTNNTTTATVKAWIPSSPGAGPHSWEMHLPHWRNNPHHFTAGEGFLYPSGDMQPGGASSTSEGKTYSRPRGFLNGSYVGRQLQFCTVSGATNETDGNPAQLKTVADADIALSLPGGGVLRVQRVNATRTPLTGLIQFEDFTRANYIVTIGGMTQQPELNGSWRVSAVGGVLGVAGSFIDLVQLNESTPATPGSITGGAVPSGVAITRQFYEPQHRFGSLLETCWRMANSIGKRVTACHLSINSSGQISASTNNAFGYQGKIGWRDDDDSMDWTPSNPDGNAARMHRLLTFIMPHAFAATFGDAVQPKILAFDNWNLEADALVEAGRELAHRTVPTFVAWLRGIANGAGLNPYSGNAKIPFHWAQLSHEPWEMPGSFYGVPGVGDIEQVIRAVLLNFVATDRFGASINTDASPKLDGTTFFGPDILHFNGFGEATNGENAATEIMRLIHLAFEGETTFVVEDGSGLSSANSYCSVEDADLFHQHQGNPGLWVDASLLEKQDALRRATSQMNWRYGLVWSGRRATSEQALAWPRYGATDDAGNCYPSDEIPTELADATAYAALLILQDVEVCPTIVEGADIESESKSMPGPLSKSVKYRGGKPATPRLNQLDRMLSSAGLTLAAGYGWGVSDV